MNFTVKASCLVLLLVANGAWAECSRPDQKPKLANGSKASKEAMIESNKAVKAYVKATTDYLACLEEEEREAAASGETSEEAKAARLEAYNSAVDDMSTLAAAFNTEIQKYKAKAGQ